MFTTFLINLHLNASNNTSTFDVAQLRLAYAVTRVKERNARAGARYTEWLTSHWGVRPQDSRLQRAEYIGGSKSPVIISEVLQTGSTDETSPQGNMAGHGIAVDAQFAGKYRVQEYGMILGMMSVMPKPGYQNGVNRQWLYESPYDFPMPEFVNLSEQPVYGAELFAGDEVDNRFVFGWQGIYNEHRYKPNMVVVLMRSLPDPAQDLAFWNLARVFDGLPVLDGDFVTCVPRKDIFAVPSQPGLIVNVGNILRVVRPLPLQAEPGLTDHV